MEVSSQLLSFKGNSALIHPGCQVGPGKTSEVEGTYTEQLQDGEKLVFQTLVLVI